MGDSSRASILKDIFKQRLLRFGLPIWLFVSGYDGVSSQLELPTIKQLWGMSGQFLPWWGWLITLQTLLLLGLFEYLRKVPAPVDAVELARLNERLKRAEERLDGGRVVAAVGNTLKKKPSLTMTDRERCSVAIRDVNDLLGEIEQHVYTPLVRAICGHNPPALADVEVVESQRHQLSSRASQLWHAHSHYLDLIEVDILPVIRDVEALKNPMADAVEAKDWPLGAQKERANALNTGFSNLGVSMGDLRKNLVEKRRDFLDA